MTLNEINELIESAKAIQEIVKGQLTSSNTPEKSYMAHRMLAELRTEIAQLNIRKNEIITGMGLISKNQHYCVSGVKIHLTKGEGFTTQWGLSNGVQFHKSLLAVIAGMGNPFSLSQTGDLNSFPNEYRYFETPPTIYPIGGTSYLSPGNNIIQREWRDANIYDYPTKPFIVLALKNSGVDAEKVALNFTVQTSKNNPNYNGAHVFSLEENELEPAYTSLYSNMTPDQQNTSECQVDLSPGKTAIVVLFSSGVHVGDSYGYSEKRVLTLNNIHKWPETIQTNYGVLANIVGNNCQKMKNLFDNRTITFREVA